jgi:hypothetical protein
MTVRELLASVRDKLQDTESVYWSDSEFIDLYNECKRYLSAERKEAPTTTTLDLTTGVYEYTIDGVLRYVSVKDSNSVDRPLYADDGSAVGIDDAIIVQAYNSIYVNTPETGVTLTIKHISFPSEDNLNDTVRQGDEESYRYFILSKAYEKDTDMEQFQKAGYFMQMFMNAMKSQKKNNTLNYINNPKTTKSYFF